MDGRVSHREGHSHSTSHCALEREQFHAAHFLYRRMLMLETGRSLDSAGSHSLCTFGRRLNG